MKICIIGFVLSLMALSGMSQKKDQIIIDKRIDRAILYGRVSLVDLNDTLCKQWFKPEYKAYKIDSDILSELNKKDLSEVKMTLVLGSWCHDSHLQVPRLFKLLDTIKYPMSELEIFAVDTYKKATGIDTEALDIKRVPTLIVYKEGKELGRIIERPKISLEADLLKIVK